jgi:hypothetical protein
MRAHERDLRRQLGGLAENSGVSMSLTYTNGGHMKAVFATGDRKSTVILSASPSCRFANRRIEQDARHAINKLKGSIR